MPLRKTEREAFEAQTPVRVVIAHTENTKEIQAGHDASKIKKTFALKEDWVGKVTSLVGDDDEFTFWKVSDKVFSGL